MQDHHYTYEGFWYSFFRLVDNKKNLEKIAFVLDRRKEGFPAPVDNKKNLE